MLEIILVTTATKLGNILMKNGRLRIFAVALIHCCLLMGLVSVAPFVEQAQAQSSAQPESLMGLIGKLEELGGKAGKIGSQLGSGSAVDRARREATQGVGKSPFGSSEESKELERQIGFTVSELLLIEKYCRGLTDQQEEQLLQTMGEFSSTEKDYCRRASDRLFQIGYGIFEGEVTPDLLVNGTISDDYILGIGDELVLSFEGKRNDSVTLHVNREGRVVYQDIGRLPAAGRSFAEFRNALKRTVKNKLFGTKVYLSMGAVRLIAVRVTGEVSKPGLHQATGLSSVFDAITLAGGIKKTGSLRQIQVRRSDSIFWIDAYEMLYTQFGGQDTILRDGDHIMVPPIGRTVAVSGNVKRAGIFELSEGQTGISVDEAIAFAGGLIRPKGNLLTLQSFDASGRETHKELPGREEILDDGDILVIGRKDGSTHGTVSIVGHVSNPGVKPISSVPTVRTLLLNNNSFKRNPYLLFGVLDTSDPSTYSRRYFPINLQEIVNGKLDYALRDKDRLIVFSQEEVRYLASDEVRLTILKAGHQIEDERVLEEKVRIEEKAKVLATAALNKMISRQRRLSGGQGFGGRSSDQFSGGVDSEAEVDIDIDSYACSGLRNVGTILQFTRSGRFSSVIQAVTSGVGTEGEINPRPCPAVFDKNPDLLPFVLEHAVAVNGEVRAPGAFPITSGTPISSLVAVVGGMTLEADTSNVEISRFNLGEVERKNHDFSKTRLDEVRINPGDVIRFNPLFKARDIGPVLLAGEFVRPGLYDIRRGEVLSELFARAGGITDQAYPYGSVFTRERVKLAEKKAFQRAARELKSAAMYSAGKAGVNPTALVALQNLTDEISNTKTVGRVVIEADPTVLQVRPELDTVLEPGDRIFMPKRPNSVLVIGDILNPGALQFISGTKVDEYVRQAGGLQISADEDRMFLVYPNGVAQPVSVSVWNYNPVQVPPGSTVVVPKDPMPLNIFEFAKDMTALLSQMAITAASLAVIGNN
jgi:polysaccharide biosynthesis/export protein